MKHKKVILTIVITIILFAFLYVGVRFISNSLGNPSDKQTTSDNSSIVYFIDTDKLIRAEIRLDNVLTNGNPLAIYVPFRISSDNIRYDDEKIILGVKEYDCYSIITVFVTDESEYVFLELINNNKEMYNGIGLNAITQEGVRNVELRIKANELNRNLAIHNLLYIKHYFVNISQEVQIQSLSDKYESYIKLSANEDYEIFMDNGVYEFKYTIDSYVNEETDSTAKIIFELVLIPVLFAIAIALTGRCVSDDYSKKTTKIEIVVVLFGLLLSMVGICTGYIKKIEKVYLIIEGLFFLWSIGAYILWKKEEIYAKIKNKSKNTG